MGIFAGEVIEKRDLAVYNNAGDSVINITVGYSKEVFGGILKMVKANIVFFKGLADKVDDEIEIGDHVFIGEATRSPRIYQTKSGSKVETVDLIAQDYTKISEKQFKKSWPELEKAIIPESELTFQAADRETARVSAVQTAQTAEETGSTTEIE